MDFSNPQLLSNILSKDELLNLNPSVQDKLKKYFEEFFDEYCKEKAAANRLGQCEELNEELKAVIEDYKVKIDSFEKNVAELRSQLDVVSAERANLSETVNRLEQEYAQLRQEKNRVAEEHDSLRKVVERQNAELERFQVDMRSHQQQLKAAISARCEALARIDEIESKAVAIDSKEKRMEQEKALLQTQIETLTHDLNRTVLDLQNSRRDSKLQCMQLETNLSEKIQELKVVQAENDHYKEANDRLTQNVQELTAKLFAQNEEANKMMDYYKRELEAKSKLADVYKSNCEDTEMERQELENAIADLKRMLNEASDQYGELETRLKAMTLQHEQELEEKDNIIETLKTEINHANVLLKEVQQETVESALSKIAPSAAVASRLIRSDMSLTELYSLYAKATEDLELQKRENARLDLQLKEILQELSENAPVINKQGIEYAKLVEANNILSQQRDELLGKKCELDEILDEAQTKINHVERENKKLRQSQADLSRQVCFLLREVELLRSGLNIDQASSVDDSNLTNSDEVLTKKLVNFRSIAELQENNCRMLVLVRDLTEKLEEAELTKNELNEAVINEKLKEYAKKRESMQDLLNKQNNTIATLLAKCERYKKMYFSSQRGANKPVSGNDLSDNEEDVDMNDSANKEKSVSKDKDSSEPSESHSSRIRELEKKLEETEKEFKDLKERHEFYIQEKKNNEKLYNEQFESMRSEVRELTSNNCKLMSTVEYNKEQIKLQQKNISTYKQQISTLEDRNKNYETTIYKHEQTVTYLRDELMRCQRGQAAVESEVNHLRHENRILKDSIARLQSEKDSFQREHKNQALLLNNLEIIKSNLERSEMEGKARLEQRLDDTVRELSAQRRRFQEEEDRFRETVNDLKRQAESAKKMMLEEKAIAEKVQKDLTALRAELNEKVQQNEELSKKLQDVLTPSKNDNPIAVANKKIRELELKLEEARIEITSLNNELTKSREHAEQYYKMSQSAETEIKNLHETHTEYVKNAEAEISSLKQIELDLKSRVEELEAETQLATVSEVVNTNQCDQIKQAQEDLKTALNKLTECNRTLRTLRAENTELSEQLTAVETKYANEMILHSSDIQELSKLKSETSRVQNRIAELQAERDKAIAAYEELKKSHDEEIRLLQNEKTELEKRVDDLNSLNSALHEQIEALASKLTVISQPQSGSNSVANDSAMDTSLNNSELNRSQADEENKNNEQLLQIIKFLRKEKDLNIAKLDIMKAENSRLVSELTILQKRIDELNGFLNQERTQSETNLASANKHEEILRKIETLDALTDSNRVLREERNDLTNRNRELTQRISKMEDELYPLQTKTRELSVKVDELSSENTSLRTEAMKWRQRANVLVEKSNKNPEEYKRVLAERDQLLKALHSEKENLKKAQEDLLAFKNRIETEIPNLEKVVQNLTDEKKKLVEDLSGVRQNNSRMLQEIMELKNKLLQREDDLQKCATDMETKEALFQDLKSKELQIRRIAKRYKDSYLELMNKNPSAGGLEGAKDGVNNPDLLAGQDASMPSAETSQQADNSTIDSLNNVIKTMQEENDKLRKDYDDLKAAVEVDEQTKALLRDARSKIVSLTESKNVISQELATTKNRLQSVMQSSENQDTTINEIRAEYEDTMARMEKELVEQTNLNKEAIARLTRENESLVMRVSQLSRQLGLQQSSKPSTSTVAITEKGCITESSPRTANVKPMSGSTTMQQSATVTPWRGGETPLASIRPISVQNSRTAAILPTSQQSAAGTSSSSSTSSTSTSSTTPPSVANTALVPPQQQVHTTGTSSLETMSSSPTSSHADYMPSTSSASVAVAAIPPMGSSGTVAESSQEAESVQQQQSESQMFVGSGQQQVVALVSPRVEGSQNTVSTAPANQVEPLNPQPSTSGTTSSTSHIAVSSHSRHTPSSSSVTTSQAGSSVGHKRPRDQEGDSSTSNDECSGDKTNKQMKRMRNSVHVDEADANIGDMGIDVDQVPTSSQRDQDDIVVVDSDEEDAANEPDDGPAEADVEHEVYDDSYEQDQEMEENECPEPNEGPFRADESDNNEVDVDIACSENQAQCAADNQADEADEVSAPSTSKAATSDQDNNQQSQTITSGSGSAEQSSSVPSASASPSSASWKQATSTQGSSEIGSSPQGSYKSDAENPSAEAKSTSEEAVAKPATGTVEESETSQQDPAEESKKSEVENSAEAAVDEFGEEPAVSAENEENLDNDGQLSTGASQSEIQEIQQSQMEDDGGDDGEMVDGVTSEGEKGAIEEIEEEGREAEATTSPTVTTRSKTTRGGPTPRRMTRGIIRGGNNNRPTPIIWQDSPGTSRNAGQSPNQMRGSFANQRNQRGRRMRRPSGNFHANPNMRFQ